MKEKEDKIGKKHKEELGLNIPENYFSSSKKAMLSNVLEREHAKVLPLYAKPINWLVAASIALLVGLFVFNQNSFLNSNNIPKIVSDTIDEFQENDLFNIAFFEDEDILIESLFLEDEFVENFAVNFLIEDILIDELIEDLYIDELMNDDLLGF